MYHSLNEAVKYDGCGACTYVSICNHTKEQCIINTETDATEYDWPKEYKPKVSKLKQFDNYMQKKYENSRFYRIHPLAVGMFGLLTGLILYTIYELLIGVSV